MNLPLQRRRALPGVLGEDAFGGAVGADVGAELAVRREAESGRHHQEQAGAHRHPAQHGAHP